VDDEHIQRNVAAFVSYFGMSTRAKMGLGGIVGCELPQLGYRPTGQLCLVPSSNQALSADAVRPATRSCAMRSLMRTS
jgi:hypothetical protein